MSQLLAKILFLLVFFTFVSGSAHAQNRSHFHPSIESSRNYFSNSERFHRNRQYAQQRPPGNMISAGEAKQIAEDRYGGKALSVTLQNGGGPGFVYRVKLIKAGRIRVVTIPANP